MHALSVLALAPKARLGSPLGSIVEPRHARRRAVAYSVHPFPVLAFAPDANCVGPSGTIVEPGHARHLCVANSVHPLRKLAFALDAWRSAVVETKDAGVLTR